MNKTDHTNSKINGFTLIELLISLAIFSIVSASIYMTYASQQETYVVQEGIADMQQNLRAGMYIMAREIRMAGYDPNESAGAGIISAGDGTAGNPFRFSYVADTDGDDNDNDGATDEADELATIEYSLYDSLSDGDNELGREVIFAGSSRDPLAQNIDAINFVYLDSSGTATTTINDIRSIQITMIARVEKEDEKFLNGFDYTNQQGASIFCVGSDGDDNDNDGVTDETGEADHFRRRRLTCEIRCRNLGI